MNQEKERNNFTGTLGFVLASAASAIGLGNIWRFPFLAARDGGGLFLVCYLLLVATFGYTLLSSEIAIGRKTRQGPLTAYTLMDKRGFVIGVLACMVPVLILPYYCVIGGWVLKYLSAAPVWQLRGINMLPALSPVPGSRFSGLRFLWRRLYLLLSFFSRVNFS